MDEEDYKNIKLTLIICGLVIFATITTVIGFKFLAPEVKSCELSKQSSPSRFYSKYYLGGLKGKSSQEVIKSRSDLKWRPDGTENGFKGGASVGFAHDFQKIPVWVGGETTFFLENSELNKTVENQEIVANKRIIPGYGFGVSALLGVSLKGIKPYVRVGQEWVNTSFEVYAANEQTEELLRLNHASKNLSRTTLFVPAYVWGIGFSAPLSSHYSLGVELSQSVSKKTNAFKELPLSPIQIKKTSVMVFVKKSF